MLKKSMKMVAILVIAMITVMVFSNTVFAEKMDLNTGFEDAQDVIQNTTGVDGNAANSIAKMAKAIIQVVQVIGMAVAVIMLIVLAIIYISAAPSDKADIKKHAVVYVVGAVVLFAASGILEIVKQFATNIG